MFLQLYSCAVYPPGSCQPRHVRIPSCLCLVHRPLKGFLVLADMEIVFAITLLVVLIVVGRRGHLQISKANTEVGCGPAAVLRDLTAS